MKALPKQYKVFKLQFASGGYDMVIYDRETNSCAVYEVKHSSQYVREQARHLLDEEKFKFVQDILHDSPSIQEKCVLQYVWHYNRYD